MGLDFDNFLHEDILLLFPQTIFYLLKLMKLLVLLGNNVDYDHLIDYMTCQSKSQ